MRKCFFLFLIILFTINSCKKEDDVNPYDLIENKPPVVAGDLYDADPNTIAGLHKNIFKPVCANSGCHDGSFEPDFRTIESAYNMLVLHPVIKNDPAGSFTYRVVPADPDASVIMKRLTADIDGQSGIMPLVVDQESDWESRKVQYIQNVRTWILNGAKDMFGNGPVASNLPPQLSGVFIAVSGTQNPLPRNVQSGAVVVPAGTASIDVYFSFTDDQTPVDGLGYMKVKTGTSMNNFADYQEQQLTAVPAVIQPGYSGNPVSFSHRFSVNVSALPLFQRQFLRVYLQHNSEMITEIPRTEGAEHIKKYYSFQVGQQ